MFTSVVAEQTPPSRAAVLLIVVGTTGSFLALMVGAYGAAFGQRWGAYLMIGGLFDHFLVYWTIGVLEYRAVMNRPWPKVAPLADEDDEW